MKNAYYEIVLQLISKFFADYSKPQQKNFADVVSALFYNESFVLIDISKNLQDETSIIKKLKRFICFLDSLTIDKAFFRIATFNLSSHFQVLKYAAENTSPCFLMQLH
jgi:hypothetical protein